LVIYLSLKSPTDLFEEAKIPGEMGSCQHSLFPITPH